MDFDASAQVDALAKLPPEPPKPPPGRWNGWSAPLRGLAAGAAEVGAFAADAAKGYGQIMSAGGTERAAGMFGGQTEAERRESELQRIKLTTEGVDTTSESGTALRDVARDYRPDPATAGLAERLTFDLTRFLGKAVGYSVLGAGVPGAVALGADESMVVADDLMRGGVDPATRMKAGMVAGVAAAAGVVLPVAAPGSVAKTVGLWALGGPGAFVAQQAATREILAGADYGELAGQYDPFDPVGLAVSSLVPAGFAAWAMRGARVRPTKPGAPPVPTPEQVDAVMTHNLTLARDVHEASTPPAATSDPTSFASRLEVAIVERGLAVEMGERSMASGEAGARKITIADMPENEFMAKHGNSVDDVKAHEFAHTFWHGATGLPNFRDPANKALRAELRLASKEFRPFVWEANSKHANSADELLADGMAFWIKNPDRRADFPAIDKMMRGYDAGDLIRNFPDSPRPAPLPAEAIPPRPVTEVDAFAARMAASEEAVQAALEPVKVGAGKTAARPDFDKFAQKYVESQPVDKFDYERRLSEAETEIRNDYMVGNKDGGQFGEQLQKEDAARFFDEDGDLTDAGDARYIELQDQAIAKEARDQIGEPQQRAVDFSDPADAAQLLRDYLDAAGLDPNVVGGSGKSRSKYFEIENGKRMIRISDHELPDNYVNDSDIEVLLPQDSAEALSKIKAVAAEIVASREGAPTPDSGKLGLRTLSNQDAGAVSLRADESGQLTEPAQSESVAGSGAKTTGVSGKAQDPHIASTLSRVEALKAQSPDLPVAMREDGSHATLADELDAIRRQAREGTADTYVQARADGVPIAQAVQDLNLPPEVTNLVAGIVENAHSAPRIEALAREVMKTVENFKTEAAGVTADAVERLRTLTDEQITGAQAKVAKSSDVEPMLASMQERIARIEALAPDMAVRTDEAGQPVTVAKEMARIREEARKGTDMELGADDADLVSVAANCTLSVGA